MCVVHCIMHEVWGGVIGQLSPSARNVAEGGSFHGNDGESIEESL